MNRYTHKEQTFTDIWGRLFRIVDEEFDMTLEDIKKWDVLAETNPLPPVNKFYISFIHPEAGY